MKTATTKPFVKWAGGKQALAAQIVKAMPDHFGTYFEPFLGGGSVFLTRCPDHAQLSDANAWLIQTYEAIRDDLQRGAAILDELPNTKDDFLRIRLESRSSTERFARAAHFIYLNKTCFRGLYRCQSAKSVQRPIRSLRSPLLRP